MRGYPDLFPRTYAQGGLVSGGLRALLGERSGTAALAMSKSLESQRRKDSVGGTWPKQIRQKHGGMNSKKFAQIQMIVTRERSV
jgi:hypothetical protein